MAELKIQHILILAYLLSNGARHNFVTVTTSKIGRHIQKSQQTASKHLIELEDRRLIERSIDDRNISIRVSKKGHSEIVKLSSTLQKSLKAHASGIELEGRLVSGMGEGAYYMSRSGYTKQFKTKIGYVPFPGTLNVKIGKRVHREAIKQLEEYEGIKIDGFSDKKRTFGWVKCFDCVVNDSIKCKMITLERTHHDDTIIELISRVCIREKCSLADGSRISMKILPDA